MGLANAFIRINCLVVVIFTAIPRVDASGTQAADRGELSLEAYTELVQGRNPKMRALASKVLGSDYELAQAELLTSTKAFTELSRRIDRSPVLTPEFTGEVRTYNDYRTGVEKQWEFGVKNRFYVVREEQRLEGVSALQNPNLSFSRLALGVDADLPLLKNGFGRNVKLETKRLEAGAKGEVKITEAQSLETMIKAQATYIEFVQLEASLFVQKELVTQGERLVAWVRRQVRDRLLERVHLAEAEGALEARRLGLVAKELKWKNTLNQIAQWVQIPDVGKPRVDNLETLEKKIARPAKIEKRKDLEGRAYILQSERNRLLAEREQFRPDLTLKAKYLSYQRTDDFSDSQKCRGITQCHHYNVAVEFSIPLDFTSLSRGKSSVRHRIESMELELENEQKVAAVEIETLHNQSENLKRQIDVLRSLIQSREIRLGQERERQKRGRSTTFDLIRAEQELSESIDHLLEARAQRLLVFTQMQYFRTDQ